MFTKLLAFSSSIPWSYSWYRQQEFAQWFSQHGWHVLFLELAHYEGISAEVRSDSPKLDIMSAPGYRFEHCIRPIRVYNAFKQTGAAKCYISNDHFDKIMILFGCIHGIICKYYFSNYRCFYDLVDEITANGRWRNERMLLRFVRLAFQHSQLAPSLSKRLADRNCHCYRHRDVIYLLNGLGTARLLSQTELHPLERVCQL